MKVTAKQLYGILVDLGYEKTMPSDDELIRRAVIFTAKQPQYDLPSEPEFRATSGPLIDVRGTERNEFLFEGPVALRVALPWPEHAFGHPRFDKPTSWRHLLQDLAAEFHGMMGQTFGKHATARFLEKLIPLVTGEAPPFGTIKRELYRQAKEGSPQRKRKHPR
jgi:hypothetical protein